MNLDSNGSISGPGLLAGLEAGEGTRLLSDVGAGGNTNLLPPCHPCCAPPLCWHGARRLRHSDPSPRWSRSGLPNPYRKHFDMCATSQLDERVNIAEGTCSRGLQRRAATAVPNGITLRMDGPAIAHDYGNVHPSKVLAWRGMRSLCCDFNPLQTGRTNRARTGVRSQVQYVAHKIRMAFPADAAAMEIDQTPRKP
jgi:hypothetical protein